MPACAQRARASVSSQDLYCTVPISLRDGCVADKGASDLKAGRASLRRTLPVDQVGPKPNARLPNGLTARTCQLQ